MKRTKSIDFILTIVFLFIAFNTRAFQIENPSETRPKIGLVLSGGGAKGMAHVGVIRYLEKAGIRPDYIVGTSMGAVIGGLYSLGYTADELEEIILSVDWDLMISNRVEFNSIAFEEKAYYNRYLVELPIKKGKIAVPSGLIEGQKLSEVLQYYTWPANKYDNFDEFPIPFRCLATDISTGQEIIFDKGYLHDAIRSSIAIPTAFTPFDLDSTSVVDGGVVNNFPVNVVKDMGADIVIGVNVSDEDFSSVEDLGGFAGILMQVAMSRSLSKTKGNIAECDIYIKPDLQKYSTGSFGNYKEILALGDAAGKKYFDDFRNLADSLGRRDIVLGLGFEESPIKINGIEFVGNKLFSKNLLQLKFDIAVGSTVTRDDIQKGIDRVYGVNGFYKVDFSLIPSGVENSYNLKIRLKEKPASLLSLAVHYDNQFSAGVLINYTGRDLLGKLSRTVFLLDISENPKGRLDYYKYFSKRENIAFNGRINLLRQQIPTYKDGKETDIQIDRVSSLDAQIITTKSLKQTFSFGGFFQNNKSRYRFSTDISDGLKNAKQSTLGLKFRYYRNSQNDRNYPTKGAEGYLETIFHLKNGLSINLKPGVDTLFVDIDGITIPISRESLDILTDFWNPDPYLTLIGKYSKFIPISKKFQLKPEVAGGITFTNQDEGKVYQEFLIGGYQTIRFTDLRFWGLNYGEIQVPNYIKAGLEAQVIPIKNIYLRAGVNYLSYSDSYSINDKDFISNIFQDGNYTGYGADLTYHSILGPITVGISSNNRDHKLRYYFSLGLSFNYSDR